MKAAIAMSNRRFHGNRMPAREDAKAAREDAKMAQQDVEVQAEGKPQKDKSHRTPPAPGPPPRSGTRPRSLSPPPKMPPLPGPPPSARSPAAPQPPPEPTQVEQMQRRKADHDAKRMAQAEEKYVEEKRAAEEARLKRAEHEAKQLERAQAKMKKADADDKEKATQRLEAEKLVLIGSLRRERNKGTSAEGAATDTAAVETVTSALSQLQQWLIYLLETGC